MKDDIPTPRELHRVLSVEVGDHLEFQSTICLSITTGAVRIRGSGQLAAFPFAAADMIAEESKIKWSYQSNGRGLRTESFFLVSYLVCDIQCEEEIETHELL